jgi:hypothetical protein
MDVPSATLPRDHDVVTHNEDWAACGASIDPELMEATFAELAADLAPVYHRRDLRANGLLYLRGLLMPQVAGNCWSIAEAVGLDRRVASSQARWAGSTSSPVLPDDPDQAPPDDCGTIALTVPEAQRLFHLVTTLSPALPPHAARAVVA